MAETSAFRALSDAAVADVIPRLTALGTFTRRDDTEYGRWNPSPKATSWTHYLRKDPQTLWRLTLWAGAGAGGDTHLQLDGSVHPVTPEQDDQQAADHVATQAPPGFGPLPQNISVKPSRHGQIDAILAAPGELLDNILPAQTILRVLAAPLWVLALAMGFVASWPMYFVIRSPLSAAQTTQRLNKKLPRLIRNMERYGAR